MKTEFGKITKELKVEIANEYAKAWDERMTSYCANKVGFAAKFPDGRILIIEKQTIKKRFYFSEGYSKEMDEALYLCEKSMTNGDYFAQINTKRMRDMIAFIESDGNVKIDNDFFGYLPRIIRTSYCGEIVPLNIFEVHGIGKGAILDGKYGIGEEMTLIEKQAALMLYRKALEDMENRCENYIKRYGTKGLLATTYWDCR